MRCIDLLTVHPAGSACTMGGFLSMPASARVTPLRQCGFLVTRAGADASRPSPGRPFWPARP